MLIQKPGKTEERGGVLGKAGHGFLQPGQRFIQAPCPGIDFDNALIERWVGGVHPGRFQVNSQG